MSVKCVKVFTSVNLKPTAILKISEGCSKHLRKHTILLRSYTKQTELKWIRGNNAMLPDYNYSALQAILNSLNDLNSITSNYKNK
jgi:hypothetical protein